MTLAALDVRDDAVVEWHRDPGAATADPHRVTDYHPTIYVDGPDPAIETLATTLAADPRVVATAREPHRPGLDRAPTDLLAVTIDRPSEVRNVARTVRTESPTPGTYRLYDVDLDPGFRYCLDRGLDPTPPPDLRTLTVRLPERAVAHEDLAPLRIDGDAITGDEHAVLATLATRLADRDPDAIVTSHAAAIPLIADRAAALDVDLSLGRATGYRQLAAESTYVSYGDVGYSPARYAIPGRAIIAEDAAFLWDAGGVAGLRYLVDAAGMPLQETARASIGTVLTAIEIREARSRDVLAPWNKWTPETFTDARTLQTADRGGFTFAPVVGLHETVHELDFASLYPSIICERNISPETVRCHCHDTADVPELGYSICDADGFLPAVLRPLIEDRAAVKRRLATEELPPAARDRLEGVSAAIKWVLVSCFGYQGYRNAKYGRIECHEAINAYARDALLTAKTHLEDAGWRVVHGIVDSLWVTATDPDPTPLADVAATVSEIVEVPLEHESGFEWVCFVPRRETGGGALTRYFGRRADGSYKYRGIEVRQRSTPTFVADAQRELIAVLDDARDPAAVCERLREQLGRLRRGAVPPADLVISTRVSKPPAEYEQSTRPVAALRRAAAAGMPRSPGQSVSFVVVADDADGQDRVRLPFEAESYDADFYADLLVRAAESVTAPLGWDRSRIERFLRDTRATTLGAFD